MPETSRSLATPATGAPVKAELDGWNLQSNSAERPSQEQLESSLRDAVGGDEPPKEDAPIEEPPKGDEPAGGEADAEKEPPVEPAPGDTEKPPVEAKGPKLPEAPKRKPSRADKLNDEIQALTYQRARVKEETQSAQGERDRLTGEIEELKRQKTAMATGAAPAAAETPAPKKALNPHPKPKWGGADGYEASGKTFDEYEEDKEAWTLEEARLIAQSSTTEVLKSHENSAREASARAAVEESERELSAQVEERVLAARQKYGTEVVDAALQNTLPIYEAPPTADLPPMPGFRALKDVVRTSEVGVELMIYFHQNPDEAKRIALQPLWRAVREMSWLEERVRSAQDGPARTPNRTVSRARPVRSPLTGAAPNARDTRGPGEAEEAMPFGVEYLSSTNSRLGMR